MATARRGRPRKDPPGKNAPCFFQVFFPKLSSHRMSIPPAFFKHVESELSGSSRKASLIGPSGSTWKVDLVKDSDGMAFDGGGWKEFAGDHSLAGGDFLVFRYDGKLRFRVSVLDQSACEKEKAFSAKPVAGISSAIAAGASDPSKNKSPARKKKKKKITTSRCRKPKERAATKLLEGKEDNESSPNQEIPTIEGNVDSNAAAKNAESPRSRKPKKAPPPDSTVSTPIRRSSRRKSVALVEHFDTPDGTKEPSEGSSEITEAAKEKETHETIPNKESIDVLSVNPEKREFMDDECLANIAQGKKAAAPSHRGKQKKQRVDSAPSTTRKSYNEKSVRPTKAETHCDTPNTAKGSEASLGSIEPKEKENSDHLRSQDENVSMKSAVSAAPAEAVRVPPKRKKVRDDECLASYMETRSQRKKAAASLTGGKRKKPPADSVPLVTGKSSKRTKRTPELAPESRQSHALADESNPALQMAKAFASEKPFGVVVMRNTYCYPRFNLRLPKIFFGKFLPKTSTEMTLLDDMGRSWAVSYLFYAERGSLRRGWRRFAVANGVRSGDACVFELVEENRMKVHIFKGDEEQGRGLPLHAVKEGPGGDGDEPSR